MQRQSALRAIIEQLFDVFAKEGMQKHIRGFKVNVDAGKVKRICKNTVFELHKSRVIMNLIEVLKAKGVVEDDKGPWNAPIAPASKHDQAHVHWSEFTFRLCISQKKDAQVVSCATIPAVETLRASNVNRSFIGDDDSGNILSRRHDGRLRTTPIGSRGYREAEILYLEPKLQFQRWKNHRDTATSG
jgi:hypothetical protein